MTTIRITEDFHQLASDNLISLLWPCYDLIGDVIKEQTGKDLEWESRRRSYDAAAPAMEPGLGPGRMRAGGRVLPHGPGRLSLNSANTPVGPPPVRGGRLVGCFSSPSEGHVLELTVDVRDVAYSGWGRTLTVICAYGSMVGRRPDRLGQPKRTARSAGNAAETPVRRFNPGPQNLTGSSRSGWRHGPKWIAMFTLTTQPSGAVVVKSPGKASRAATPNPAVDTGSGVMLAAEEGVLSGMVGSRTPEAADERGLRNGAFLDKPKTEKYNAHGEGNGLRAGPPSSMQGWRVEMEDAHTAAVQACHMAWMTGPSSGVYDGHAGSRVANYCSKHLLEHIVAAGSADELRKAGSPTPRQTPAIEAVKRGIRAGFLRIDEHMRSFTDLRNGMDRSGSTAVAVLLSPEHLYFINCGDSRALLCRNAQVCFSTLDHKPCDPREKERIQNAGGSVMIQRVNGSLAVSRALGDYDYKCVEGKGPTEQLVSPEPEVFEIARSDAEDEFVVLARDGIWDVMSNEELCALVRSRLEVTDDLERVCNEVVDTCLHKGSRDNMSIVLVCLPNAPQVSEEAVKRDAELDKYLESRVEELIEKAGEEGVPELAHVMSSLSQESIPNLPPGGGLASKHSVIEAVYNRLNPQREEDGSGADLEDPW
ncbi:LOW QUALITY PROTEIN: protein phosphatase 1B [Puntigrus tetrazona]|uniref:LOW QUALITY PROTEIN: protein phosphatase 1B n=1 Tax=Puntigrus tetrazona TaxID=1606681 RepID=UPI001C89620B|nr:LOW QUALITY PROTEIN: protein phosphatase 1B [Puntigrus tetrazona]